MNAPTQPHPPPLQRRNILAAAQSQTAVAATARPTSENELLPTQLRAEASAQQRVAMNADTVREYSEAMLEGALFPPLTVFLDPAGIYWLADGFHRLNAHRMAFGDEKRIFCRIIPGSRRDALRHALGANESHGLRRTAEDKRKAVQTAMSDDEWSKWSDREIAKLCKVSNTFVGKMRSALIAPSLTVNVDSETLVNQTLSVNVDRSNGDQAALSSAPSVNVDRSETSNLTSTPVPSVNVDRSVPTETRKFERGGKTYEMKTGSINSQRNEPTYATVWTIEQSIKNWLVNLVGNDLNKQIGTLAMTKETSSNLRTECEKMLHDESLTFRKHEVTMAINNVLDQRQQMKKERQAAANSQPPPPLTGRPLVDVLDTTTSDSDTRRLAFIAKVTAVLEAREEFLALGGKEVVWHSVAFDLHRIIDLVNNGGKYSK